MRNPHPSTGVGASGDRRIQGSMSRNGSGEKKGSEHLQVGLSEICAFEQKMRRVAWTYRRRTSSWRVAWSLVVEPLSRFLFDSSNTLPGASNIVQSLSRFASVHVGDPAMSVTQVVGKWFKSPPMKVPQMMFKID